MGNRNVIMENIIKDIDSAYAYLKTSAMFKLSLSSKEQQLRSLCCSL